MHQPAKMSSAVVGFEGYRRGFGSLWEVQIEDLRSGMFLVSYKDTDDEAWLPITQLRFRSRRADSWDCYLLKQGMDVSVLSRHPQSDTFSLQKEALYDARVTSITRSIHAPGECSCKFGLQFFSLKMDTYVDGIVLDRKLLSDMPETEVTISNMRILQQPTEMIPLFDILEAHLAKVWVPRGRGCKDAYFLIETELSTGREIKRDCLEDDIGLTSGRFGEVLSPSAPRVSTKNGDKESNCNSPSDGVEKAGLGSSRPSPGRVEGEQRIPEATSGAPLNNQTQKQSVGYADQKSGHADQRSSPNIHTKRQCEQDEEHELSDEKTPKTKRGPGRPKKVITASTRLKCRGSKTKLVPGLKTDRRTKSYKEEMRRKAEDEERCKEEDEERRRKAEDEERRRKVEHERRRKAEDEERRHKAEHKGESTETTSLLEDTEWTAANRKQVPLRKSAGIAPYYKYKYSMNVRGRDKILNLRCLQRNRTEERIIHGRLQADHRMARTNIQLRKNIA